MGSELGVEREVAGSTEGAGQEVDGSAEPEGGQPVDLLSLIL